MPHGKNQLFPFKNYRGEHNSLRLTDLVPVRSRECSDTAKSSLSQNDF